jgi:hypothetical protein
LLRPPRILGALLRMRFDSRVSHGFTATAIRSLGSC